MTDRFGDPIPTRLVTAYDRKRDQTVRRIARRYLDAQAVLERVKVETLRDLDHLEQLALADAGIKDFKAKGGNSTVFSFDGLISVQCKNRTFSGMDERAHVAKQMLEEFVAELTEGQEKDDIVQIVNSLLDTRSGEINRTAALRVVKLNLKSEKFRQAKELLQDSMFASLSKTYIYVETRENRESEPVQILLDIAKLMPRKEVKSAGPADAQVAQ
jgi:hypothetical protein